MEYIKTEDLEKIQQQLFITKKLEDGNYTKTVVSTLGDMLHCAEQLFGGRNISYTILGVEFVLEKYSRIMYNNCKNIIIRLNEYSLLDEFLAYYQLAHETIHLLSPTTNEEVSILEEGLAGYFAEWYLTNQLQIYLEIKPEDYKYKELLEFIKQLQINLEHPEYYEYKKTVDLTKQLLSIDHDIIKKVREKYPTISKLTPEHFLQIKSDISAEGIELLKKLCSHFDYKLLNIAT